MHRNPETLTTLFSSGTKLLLTSWLLGFQHEERETHNFYYADRSIWLNKRVTHPIAPNWTRLVQLQKSTRLARRQISTNCFFSKSRIPSPSLPGMTLFTPQSHFLFGVFIITSVIVTSSSRECEHLHSMCVPARALSRIVLSLTKPNDNIKKIIPQLYNMQHQVYFSYICF